METRKQFLSPGIFHYYERPVMIVEGKQQYLYDETGRRYLDAFGGIVTVSVGHSHPKLVKAVNEQNELIQHTTTIYLNDQVAYFAKANSHCNAFRSFGVCFNCKVELASEVFHEGLYSQAN